ncbi:MAG: ATP-binding protein [Xenococcaceae cyanobacterium]
MELKSHQFISFFESEQAAELCRIAIVEEFSAGKVIFEEGDMPDFLYLVLAGKVELRKCQGHSQYQSVAKALPNDFFGEFGILDGKPRSAQAIVCRNAILAKIPGSSFMKILANTTITVLLKLFSYILQRLRITTEEYVKELVYKEKMVLVGEMVNTVIHDLKSPLSGIYLASTMVKELHSDEKTVEWCDLIKAQAKHMSVMAEELLEFVRGHTELNKQPVNLARVLQRFEKLNQIYFQEAQVELVIQCPDDLVVNADENKLLRVLQNLATNSVEAFQNRGGCIEITAWATEEAAQIKIHDNGPGIPEEIRDRLFESFVTYGKQSGTGLGTAIAKSIIDVHKGDISVYSNQQKGTTFEIKIPIW